VEIALERERKLEAREGFELPDLGGEPLEPRVFTSVYYDTADHSLTNAGITLRRRTERGKSVWQLKLPADDGRLELEEPGGPASPPEELSRLLHAHLRHGGVAPVATLRTRRSGSLVARGRTTAEVTVDEVAVVDALRVSDGFVEVEIELRSGDPRRLDDIADKVVEAGASPADGRPKVFRALGVAAAPSASPDDPFKRLVELLREQLREVMAHDPGTRLGTDPESLHDMRVAARRSRALLRTGKPLFANDVTALEDELRWLGEKLGAVRDLDVLVQRLHGEADALDADDRVTARAMLRTLERRRTAARTSLLKALDGDRYFSLLDAFGLEIDVLEPSGAELTLAEIAKRQLKKLRTRVAATADDAPDDELHALRKRGKRVRYAYELAGDNAVVKRAKAFQDVLGEHQDSVVAESTLRELAANAPDRAIVAGRLIERERAGRADVRSDWRKAWKRLERAAR
jgi:CHAD domain-containing protein